MNQSQSLVTGDQIGNQVLSSRVAREGWQLPGAVVGAAGGELGGSRSIKRSLLAVAGTFTGQVEGYLDNNEAQMAAQAAAVALDNVTNASDMMLGQAASSNNPNDTWQQRDQTQSFSDWWNEYWSRQPFPSGYTQSSITLLACFISTIIFLIVVGNLLVCIAIFTEKSLKPTQNWFIASLAVSDMLLGLIVMPFSLARELMGFWIFGPLWCDIHEAVDVLLTTASINTLCLISLDRYWSITQAVSYLKKRTPRRGALMIAFVWVFSAAVSLPPLFGWKKQSSPGSSQAAPQAGNTATNLDTNQTQQPTKPMASRDLSDQPAPGASYVPYDKQEAEADVPSSRSLVVDDGDGGRRRRRERRTTRGSKRASNGDGYGGEPRDANRDQQPLTFPEIINEPELEFDSTIYQQRVELNYVHLQQQPDPAASDALPIEYPSCQLSDDVGYVLYSAIGSFYIPCAVMVFTYIKIFLAARSRARRAINKQSRAQQAAEKAKRLTASRRTILGTMNESAAAAAVAGGRVKQQLIDGDGKTNSEYREQQQQAAARGDRPNEPMASFGRLVVIERRKSANALIPGAHRSLQRSLVAKGEGGGPVMGTTADESSRIATCEAVAKSPGVSSSTANEKPAANNSESTSMITVMSNSMAELPVTRFNFSVAKIEHQLLELNERQQQQLDELKAGRDDDGPPALEQRKIEETQRKTAALLKAISQAKHDVEGELLDELLPRSDLQPTARQDQSTTDDQQPVTTPSAAATADYAEIGAPANMDQANQGCSQHPWVESTVSNSTNETCFMTIEEDSDNFASQTGRTIMMVAENAKQSSSLASRSQGIVMKMLPPTATVEQQPDSTTSAQIVTNSSVFGGDPSGALVCNNIACIRRGNKNRQRQLDQYGNRNSSSLFGSVSSDGDDDDEADEEEEEADEDDDCDDDDELLTDDYNGYSVSCGLDPYCAAGTSSSCVHCRECNSDDNQLQNDDYEQQHSTGRWRHHEHFRRGQQAAQSCQSETEAQSFTGDDNLSLTDYRSNEDNSSTVGHELQETSIDKSPRSTCGNHKRALMFDRSTLLRAQVRDQVVKIDDGGEQPASLGEGGRKRSSIGSRLARLGSGVPSLSIQSGGLLALAASRQQQADNKQQAGFGENTGTATRNLKALRQNFFNKLNQLTAKSPGSKQQKKSRCSTGKSSAQSSGSSYEPSVDCATTSNVHSIVENYNQEQTLGETDHYEPQTSGEAANVREQISNSVDDNGQQQRQQVAGLQDTWSAAADSRHFSDTAGGGDMMTIESNKAGRKKSIASSNRQQLRSGKDLSSSALNNLHNDGMQSGVADDSISATSEMTGAKPIEHQLELDDGGSAALESSNHMRVAILSGTKAANEGQLKPRMITAGGQAGFIKTNTAGSMGTATVSLGRQTGRAYLASDNERHKRKLAKARERRATLILGLIMTTFICSWMPFFTFYVVRAFCNVCRDFVSPRFEAFIFWMGYCNSAINPIIYTIFNRDFRKAFRKILFKCL